MQPPSLPTQEFQNGQWVTTTAPFRVYDNIAQSIEDHGKLLASQRVLTRRRWRPSNYPKQLRAGPGPGV